MIIVIIFVGVYVYVNATIPATPPSKIQILYSYGGQPDLSNKQIIMMPAIITGRLTQVDVVEEKNLWVYNPLTYRQNVSVTWSLSEGDLEQHRMYVIFNCSIGRRFVIEPGQVLNVAMSWKLDISAPPAILNEFNHSGSNIICVNITSEVS